MSTGIGPPRQADQYEKRFGENLSRLRQAADMSQRELAAAATGPLKRISKTEVTDLENADRSWRAIHAFIFAEALGCEPGEILGVEGLSAAPELEMDGEALTARETALIRYLRESNFEAAMLTLSGFLPRSLP